MVGKADMRKPRWKQMLMRRSARILLLSFCLLTPVVWRLLSPSHVATLPFSYSAAQGSIQFRALVAEHPHPLEFNTLLTKPLLGNGLYQRLSHAEVGIDRLNPAADFALGNYHAHLFYEEVAEAELHPHTDGVLGLDLFTPSPGFDGQNRRPGARITIDFKTKLMTVEDGAEFAPLHLPPGTVQAPLLRDDDGRYSLLLPLNNGVSYRFILGIGYREVLLPTGAVLFPNREGTGYVNATGLVPVTLSMSGQDLSVQAIALPEYRPTGILGMSLLANYRVVVDFRNDRLYLEPANSRINY